MNKIKDIPSEHAEQVALVPTETQEQCAIAKWLRARLNREEWIHVPSEGKRDERTGAIMKAKGWCKGFPDIAIFKRPPARTGYVGAAIELKRRDSDGSDVTNQQHRWLDALERCGWVVSWQPGAQAAAGWLKRLGY